MERLRRCPFGWQVAGLANLAIAPGVHTFQITDRSVFDQFPHTVEVLIRMPLRAHLRGQLVLVLQIGRPNHPRFFHGIGQRLFAIDVQPAVHRPVGDEGVGVIRCAADHRVEVLLFETLSPIDVVFGFGKLLSR